MLNQATLKTFLVPKKHEGIQKPEEREEVLDLEKHQAPKPRVVTQEKPVKQDGTLLPFL